MFERIAENYLKEVSELNDYLADHPEISSEEHNSSKRHVELLRKYGIKTEYPFNNMPTAFQGIFNQGKSPKFAILVEYDALRGMGHACGHCASGAISALAALILHEAKDEIPAEIRIIGTPDEEVTGGKVYMAENGVFDDLDVAVMIHMNDKSFPYIPFLALEAVNFEFFGVPAHAATAPWDGRNALNAMRLFFDAVDMMRQHVTPDVRIHGNIEAGGEASNIVPDYTKAEFCFRGLTDNTVEDISCWADDIGKGAALMTRTEFKRTRLGAKFSALMPKPSGDAYLGELMEKHGISFDPSDSTPGGSSDIGNVDAICPAFHPMLSIGYPYKPHTAEFAQVMKSDKVHESIRKGGIIIAEFLQRLAEDSELLKAIQKEHRENRQ